MYSHTNRNQRRTTCANTHRYSLEPEARVTSLGFGSVGVRVAQFSVFFTMLAVCVVRSFSPSVNSRARGSLVLHVSDDERSYSGLPSPKSALAIH